MNGEYNKDITMQEINEISIRQNRAIKFYNKPKLLHNFGVVTFSVGNRYTRIKG